MDVGLHAREAMRLLILATGVFAIGVGGCGGADPEAVDPGTVLRANTGTVRCTADEGGNLHVRAPADARVTVPADGQDDATAEVSYSTADESAQMPRPQRPRSISLGFIGDAPLTQGPSYGGRYSYGAHDNLLPPHQHARGFTDPGYGYRYGAYGYRSYAYGPRW